jgi:hypothetical protein
MSCRARPIRKRAALWLLVIVANVLCLTPFAQGQAVDDEVRVFLDRFVTAFDNLD